MSTAFYDSDDGDDVVCPLCCEPMDLSDQNFLPCPCGYRVCMWCWHRIKENYTNLCPACRSEYSDDPHAFAAVDKEEVIKNENNKKKRAKQKDTDTASAAAAATAAREHQHALHLRHHHQHQQHMQHLHREQVQQQGGRGGGGVGGANSVANRRDLANMRVVQRNLVYATGLPSGFDSEEVLRRPENFGQYGRIYKIAISVSQASEPRQGNVSAHITFAHKEDALACILATDGFWIEGRQLRSNFGTTKYCATYLRNSPCSNPECLYLHELGDEEDRFTKEEIQQRSLLAPPIPLGAVTVTGAGGPSGTGKRCTSPFLPPPVYESPENGSSTAGGSGAAPRALQQQVQQAAAIGAAAAQRGAGRGSKSVQQANAAATAPKTATSVGVAWGGAGAANGPTAQPLGERGVVGAMNRRKGSVGAASPTASPHLQAHDAVRLQEEWPSLADTAGPVPAPTQTPAAQTTGRATRNRRKKEKQQQQQQQQLLQQQAQQAQEEGSGAASPSAPPISPPQEPATFAPVAASATFKTNAPAQPSLSQPPGLGPVSAASALPATRTAAIGAAGSGQADAAAGARPPLGQETRAQTAAPTSSADTSASMFSHPFFSNGGRAAGAAAANEAPAAATAAPAPPGFSELPPASLTATSKMPASSSPPAASSPSPPHAAVSPAPQQPARSLFEERFGSGDSVFNGGMFSSQAVGGGLFAGGAAAGATASGAGSPSELPAASGAVDVTQGLLPERSSPARRDEQGSLLQQPKDINASVAGLLNRPAKSLGKDTADGGSDLSFAPLPADGADATGYVLGVAPSASTPVVVSPFGSAFSGGHFGGAFGSALFPVSTQGSGARGAGGVGNTDGSGADLSVDPFANSSGALAAMLGVTLPPVDSQSSLASKMRSGLVESHLHAPPQDATPPRAHLPPRAATAYPDFSRDMGRGREGHGHGRGVGRDAAGGERGVVHRHDYGGNQEGGGALPENQASRFSFAQDDGPRLPFSPSRGSPPMGPVPRGSPGGMGSPPHPGQQHHHLRHHHQSHAHRPFGAGRPLTPPQLGEYGGGGGGGDGQFAPPPHHHHPAHHSQHHFQPPPQQRPPQQQQQQPPQQQQQQQYSIQNGMAFLQKVLPGVSLSYGDRHPPAGAGGGGQGQGQPQGQGAAGVPTGGGVGWGDNAAGQRVDPAQAFGSSLWTMAPAPNAPRQPQGSRGGGYGAW